MVKPDGVERGIVGEIIKRFEQRGFQLIALELIHPTKELLEEHVSDDSEKVCVSLDSKPYFCCCHSIVT